ncbi:MAG TPA: FkbM family methyltransferase [Oligoflexus sp.]|uniref:FkbM family methyltransferase n=1 Tax=Oligoflexus sp. TaxID=1971216 RepID=UPI002D7F903D|nr:FkbM family methyltransferase [Oligoflexus sp.]HET9239894.1 FkbM family methyltransferase [Oligoflexus sp.]
MKANKVWTKPLLLRWSQNLWSRVHQWSQRSGWPLEAVVLRLLMLPFLPLYMLRLGAGQGFVTFYRFLCGEGGFPVYRSERDTGTMVRADSTDPWVFQQVFIQQDYRALAQKAEIRVIIDAGAYVGYSSIYFAELYPHAFIYALEPEEENFQALQRNTRHYPNIKAIQAALWKEEGFVEVHKGSGEQWAFQVHAAKTPRPDHIPSVTIQSLMQQYRLPRIDILKIDIEGAESEVFEAPGCHEWLGSVRILVVELHDHLYPGSDRTFREAIQQYEFTVRSSGENLIFEMPGAIEAPALASPQRRFS